MIMRYMMIIRPSGTQTVYIALLVQYYHQFVDIRTIGPYNTCILTHVMRSESGYVILVPCPAKMISHNA
jgi:hypothetical protein